MGTTTIDVALSGVSADRYVLMVLGAGMVASAWLVLRKTPRLTAVLWISAICFVPVWLGMSFVVYFPPATIVGLVVIVAALPVMPRLLGPADYGMAFLLLACLLPIATGGSTKSSVFDVVLQWGLALVLGRVIPLRVSLDWVYRCLAWLFTLVSSLAIIEFVTHWNPFVQLSRPNALFLAWSPLQERGGIVRAEGAFGHSIALGSSVAMMIPTTLASSLRPRTKSAMVALMVGCTVVTFSRTAMIGAVLGVVMSVIFLREGLSARVRGAVVVASVTLAAFAIPFVASTFAAAGTEATGSADYRGRLISLVPDMSIVGFSPAAHRSATGELYIGNFQSIDSSLILFGLTYGWLALVFALVLLAGAVVMILARRASAPVLSVVAQIPALATVALITQYAVVFWFVVGLALYAQAETRSDHGAPVGKTGHAAAHPAPLLS